MTTLAITAASVYVLGVAVTAIGGVMEWQIYQKFQREYAEKLDNPEHERRYGPGWVQEQHDAYQAKTRAAARRFVRAPIWPLQALAGLGRIINDAKADPR